MYASFTITPNHPNGSIRNERGAASTLRTFTYKAVSGQWLLQKHGVFSVDREAYGKDCTQYYKNEFKGEVFFRYTPRIAALKEHFFQVQVLLDEKDAAVEEFSVFNALLSLKEKYLGSAREGVTRSHILQCRAGILDVKELRRHTLKALEQIEDEDLPQDRKIL